MTGKFNAETRKLLRDAEVNGGLTNRNLFDLMVAGHEEGIESAAALATETKTMAATLASTLAQERRDLRAAIEKVRTDLMAYNEKLGGVLDVHIEDDRKQLARIASHLESEAGTINRAMTTHCADAYAHRREPRRASDPPDSDWSARLAVAGGEIEDREMGDLRRFWRVGKWIAMAAALFVIDALVHIIWPA